MGVIKIFKLSSVLILFYTFNGCKLIKHDPISNKHQVIILKKNRILFDSIYDIKNQLKNNHLSIYLKVDCDRFSDSIINFLEKQKVTQPFYLDRVWFVKKNELIRILLIKNNRLFSLDLNKEYQCSSFNEVYLIH